jgi:hypothetical protein
LTYIQNSDRFTAFKKGLKMSEFDAAFVIKFISAGIKVLSARLLLIGTLLLTFSLFAYAMYMADYIHLAIAASFSVFVFLPVRALDATKVKEEKNEG